MNLTPTTTEHISDNVSQQGLLYLPGLWSVLKKNFPLLRAIKEANNEFLHKLEKTTSANANESISAVQFESKN